MTKEKDNLETVEISRLTAASAMDFLEEYESELKHSGAVGEYTQELRDTIEKLDTALENDVDGS